MELSVDIVKKFSGFTLKVSFETKGSILGLLGASGSGKSMTLRCIAGLETPDKGKIVLNGRTLFDSEKGINLPCQKRKVCFLFQNYALFPHMTVFENIGFALKKMPGHLRKQIIMKNIQMMHLEGYENRYPWQLSGGQQQRVALARALAIEPEALLLDEPFSALDNYLKYQVEKQLMEVLSNYTGVTVFVSHNLEEVYRICSKLIILSDGYITAAGDMQQIFDNPPTIQSAQLTGCKNLSKARYLSGNQLYAIDWGIKLSVKETLKESLGHVGIRAHYIKPALEIDNENVFPCWPSFISEAPFRVTIYLSIGKGAKNSEDYHLQWEVSKEKWIELKEQPLPWKIFLNPAKLMTFYS